jgi:hypothetical protein
MRIVWEKQVPRALGVALVAVVYLLVEVLEMRFHVVNAHHMVRANYRPLQLNLPYELSWEIVGWKNHLMNYVDLLGMEILYDLGYQLALS